MSDKDRVVEVAKRCGAEVRKTGTTSQPNHYITFNDKTLEAFAKELQGEGEAVSWQWQQFDELDGWGNWQYCGKEQYDIINEKERPHFRTRKLYLHPPTQSDEVVRLQQKVSELELQIKNMRFPNEA